MALRPSDTEAVFVLVPTRFNCAFCVSHGVEEYATPETLKVVSATTRAIPDQDTWR